MQADMRAPKYVLRGALRGLLTIAFIMMAVCFVCACGACEDGFCTPKSDKRCVPRSCVLTTRTWIRTRTIMRLLTSLAARMGLLILPRSG